MVKTNNKPASSSPSQLPYVLFLILALSLAFYLQQRTTIEGPLGFPPPSPLHQYLSTKNTYHYSGKNVTLPTEGCVPVHFGLLSRHGTRYPSPKVGKKMTRVLSFLEALKNKVPLHPVWHKKDIRLPFEFSDKTANVLTPRGRKEMYLLGWRWYDQLPQLFDQALPEPNSAPTLNLNGIFSISATQTFRTWQSAKCFQKGVADKKKSVTLDPQELEKFFETELTEEKYRKDLSFSISPSSQPDKSSAPSVYVRPSASDFALRFFDHCDKYLAEVRGEGVEERKKHSEQKTFEAPPEDSHGKKVLTLSKKTSKAFKAVFFNQITSRFNQHWQLKQHITSEHKIDAGFEDYLSPDWELTGDFVDDLWTLCTNELSHVDTFTNWCSEFSHEDGLIFDFQSDIKNYYEKAYGQNISYHIAAPLLQEIYSQLRTSALESPSVHLRFAHAETILPLYSILGLYKDEFELNEKVNLEQMTKRQFRSSVISPMGANIAFLLFKCPASSSSSPPTRDIVKIYVNEREEKIPGCDDECELHEFAALYQSHLTSSLDSLCRL
eukprot:TRINITY_DN2613_c0_g1_i1.p1 TRINITY_DN2613_c0_g1~~TRINITY_DN2613_c0_g1_i1.p1  ORF type:complete len:551 (+),score=120.38 TRINITY_DN2613_c0_g1_i1:56-1708(+)